MKLTLTDDEGMVLGQYSIGHYDEKEDKEFDICIEKNYVGFDELKRDILIFDKEGK